MIWLSLVILLLCSAVASGSETALFSLDRPTLNRFRDAPKRLHRRVYALMQRPRRVLMTVLITNTAANVAIFATSYVVLGRLQFTSPALAAAGGILVLFVVIIFSEKLPKTLALSSAKALSPLAACIVSVLQAVLAPVQWVLGTFLINPLTRFLSPAGTPTDTVSEDELKLLVEQSAGQGLISSRENEMLRAVVLLGDATVREVMTPRVDIQSVRIDDDPQAILETLRTSPRRELLVCGRDMDDIHGHIRVRDLLLSPTTPIRKLIRPTSFVPEQSRLAQVIRHFREERIDQAVVVDEYGGTTGLVSIRDVLERIVGSLGDYDAQATTVTTERIDESTYRLSGDLSVRVWADRFGAIETDRHIHTLAGLVLARLGRIPREGDSLRLRNLTLTVEKVTERRIESLILHRDKSAQKEREDSP